MANVTIKLDSNNQPYYVDQFGAPARPGQTVQWKAENGKFAIAILDAKKFFSGRTNPTNPPAFSNIEKFVIDSAGTATSETYTIDVDIQTGTQKEYQVFCITNQDPADAPPKIIITPAT